MLTILTLKKDSDCLPILKWLLNQRNDQGGFEGTQDTIVGLEALANFAAKISSKDTKIKIEAKTEPATNLYFDINRDNALVLQSQKIPSDTKTVRINASGKGFALLEIGCRYNTKEAEPKLAFDLETKARLLTENLLNLEITTKYQTLNKTNESTQSNMAILEVAMPSGFVISSQSLENIKTNLSIVKRIETKNSETVGIIYFDHLSSETITLTIDGFREHLVDEQKPSTIAIYDYYDNCK